MTTAEIMEQAPLLFSDAAAAKVRELIAEEGEEGLMLRVFISGGGCSGFQYGFTFEENIGEGDTVIDYTEDLQGAQFVIRNPNATTTCGCGSSFSV
jgi:iron-sulfur cluster insertion protein